MDVLAHTPIVYSMLDCLLDPENDSLTEWAVVCLSMSNKALLKEISTKVSLIGVRYRCFAWGVFQVAADEGFVDLLEMFWRPPLSIAYEDKMFLYNCMLESSYAGCWLIQHRRWALDSWMPIEDMAECLCSPESLPATWCAWLRTQKEYLAAVLRAPLRDLGRYSKRDALRADPAFKASEQSEDFNDALARLEAQLLALPPTLPTDPSTTLILEQLSLGLHTAVRSHCYSEAKRIHSVLIAKLPGPDGLSLCHLSWIKAWVEDWDRGLDGLYEMPNPQRCPESAARMRLCVQQGLPEYIGPDLELDPELLCALSSLSRDVLIACLETALQDGAMRLAHHSTCVLDLLSDVYFTQVPPRNYGREMLVDLLCRHQPFLLSFKTPQALHSFLDAHGVDIVSLLDSCDWIGLLDFFCQKGERDFVVWAAQITPGATVETKSILVTSCTSIWDWALLELGNFFDGLTNDEILDGFRCEGSLQKAIWLMVHFPDVFESVAEDLISVCARDLAIVELVLLWLLEQGVTELQPTTVDAICPHICRHRRERHGVIFNIVHDLLDRSSPVQAALLDRVQSYSLFPTPARKPTARLDN